MSSLLRRASDETGDLFETMQNQVDGKDLAGIQDHMRTLDSLKEKFNILEKEKPWILQKISLQGIILVKECI